MGETRPERGSPAKRASAAAADNIGAIITCAHARTHTHKHTFGRAHELSKPNHHYHINITYQIHIFNYWFSIGSWRWMTSEARPLYIAASLQHLGRGHVGNTIAIAIATGGPPTFSQG